jgi:hypothetical protein
MDLGMIRLFSALLKSDSGESFRAPSFAPETWRRIVHLAHHHGLASRLYRLLRIAELAGAECPGLTVDSRQSLEAGFLRAHEMHLLAEALVPQWIAAFEAEKIPIAMLKGWGLARRIYAVPEDRDFYDIDFLFPAGYREKVESRLMAMGLKRIKGGAQWRANSHKSEFQWIANPKVVLECHFGLGYGRYEFGDVWGRIEKTRISDGFELPHLSAADEYLFLVYHAGIQHRFQKLHWLLDLIQFRRCLSFERLDSEALRVEARSLKMESCFQIAEDLVRYVLTPNSFSGASELFLDLTLGDVETSIWKKARIRALLQGGWISMIQYGLERAWAQARHEQ